MRFCPECENLLYNTEDLLYCKACKRYYVLKGRKLVPRLVLENEVYIPDPLDKLKNDDIEEFFEVEFEVPKKKRKILPKSSYNYADFFPYDTYRESQEKIIKQIEESARDKKIVLLSAPNGTGKTIIALSALFPVAIENDLKIIYMCRTHSQNSRVIKELLKISNKISENGKKTKISGLSIRGRNEMCLNKTLLQVTKNPREAMSVCSDLRNNKNCIHFLNLLKKKNDLDNPVLISPKLFEKPVDAEDLIKFCKEKKLCPYFLSKFLLSQMRLIICNYQWIFNPFIRESFLKFIGSDLEKTILILDECHNIIDVATDVNSDRITPYSLRLCLRDMEMYKATQEMQNFVNLLISHLTKKKNKLRSEEKALDPSKFLDQIIKKLGFSDLNQFRNLLIEMSDFSVSIHNEKVDSGQISRDFIGSLVEFWLKWLDTYTLDNYFFCYTVKEGTEKRKTISLEIVALDPREIAMPILKNCYSCVNLSGTVNPYVFNNLMGLNSTGKSYKGIITGSPFRKKNIRALITEGVDTRRENRTPLMYKKIISKINEVLYCTPANVGVFCASYKILRGLVENGLQKIASDNNKKLFVEEPGLSASENAYLLEDFKSMATVKNRGGVLLGVCGGRNSEGEDYPGDLMNSVIIAGFPYHLPTPRVQAKIDYYDKVFDKQGWNFAYLYPAIQRANQASGRPIRKADDKGAIVFMDTRFKDKYMWISDWVKKEVETVPDKKMALVQHLYPFWNE